MEQQTCRSVVVYTGLIPQFENPYSINVTQFKGRTVRVLEHRHLGDIVNLGISGFLINVEGARLTNHQLETYERISPFDEAELLEILKKRYPSIEEERIDIYT